MSLVPGQDFPNEPALDELRDRLQDELRTLQAQLDRLHRLFAERQESPGQPERCPHRLLTHRPQRAVKRS